MENLLQEVGNDDIMVVNEDNQAVQELWFDWRYRQTIGYGCTRRLPIIDKNY